MCAGEPGQLEARLRQLDQALDAGRHHLKQREAAANGADVDSTYMGYVSGTPMFSQSSNIPARQVEVWTHTLDVMVFHLFSGLFTL